MNTFQLVSIVNMVLTFGIGLLVLVWGRAQRAEQEVLDQRFENARQRCATIENALRAVNARFDVGSQKISRLASEVQGMPERLRTVFEEREQAASLADAVRALEARCAEEHDAHRKLSDDTHLMLGRLRTDVAVAATRIEHLERGLP